jgi:hypothetical protein
MPGELTGQIQELEDWARANLKDSRADSFKFWSLKAPAIVVSACGGVFAYLNLKPVTIAAGAVASICVLLDGVIRAGTLRSVHLRAVHDLRNLQHEILFQWRVGSLRDEHPDKLAAEIVADAHKERKKIAAYLLAAETTASRVQGAT